MVVLALKVVVMALKLVVLALKLVVMVEELIVVVEERTRVVQELKLMVFMELEWLCHIKISKLCTRNISIHYHNAQTIGLAFQRKKVQSIETTFLQLALLSPCLLRTLHVT